MTTHVLVPVDGSDPADAALEFALSEYPDATITALHVIDPADVRGSTVIESGAPETYAEYRTRQQERGDDVLADARARADDHGVTIGTEQMIGGVVPSIVGFAEGNDADHIVMGSHGRTGASRVLLGSVAENVARRAPVPVTVVR